RGPGPDQPQRQDGLHDQDGQQGRGGGQATAPNGSQARVPDGGGTAAPDGGQVPAPDGGRAPAPGGRAGGRVRFGRHRLAQPQERAEAEALPGVQDRAGRLGEIGPGPASNLWLLPALLGQSWHPVTRAPIHPARPLPPTPRTPPLQPTPQGRPLWPTPRARPLWPTPRGRPLWPTPRGRPLWPTP